MPLPSGIKANPVIWASQSGNPEKYHIRKNKEKKKKMTSCEHAFFKRHKNKKKNKGDMLINDAASLTFHPKISFGGKDLELKRLFLKNDIIEPFPPVNDLLPGYEVFKIISITSLFSTK